MFGAATLIVPEYVGPIGVPNPTEMLNGCPCHDIYPLADLSCHWANDMPPIPAINPKIDDTFRLDARAVAREQRIALILPPRCTYLKNAGQRKVPRTDSRFYPDWNINSIGKLNSVRNVCGIKE